jgi:hypothetical protein
VLVAEGVPKTTDAAACLPACLPPHALPDLHASHLPRCSPLQGPAAAAFIRTLVERAVQAAAPLQRDPDKLAAAAEVAEKAARTMRLAAGGWPAVMWAVLGSLQMA